MSLRQVDKPETVGMVPFRGTVIPCAIIDGTVYVAAKGIAKDLGLDWRAQRRMILGHEALSQGGVVATLPTDGGFQDQLCLPAKMVHGWLMMVPASRYRDDVVRERIIAYQIECFDAIYAYWTKGYAINPRISESQLQELETTIKELRKQYDLIRPLAVRGEISSMTGRERWNLVRAYFRSTAKKKANARQLELEFPLL